MKGVIIYVSSNREYPQFEERIRKNLLENCGSLPIISVTQKPTRLGQNIVVGDSIGVSGFNMFRQVLIGCRASDADYVISCEADTVYPPDYFQFVPNRLDVCYRNSNLFVMGQHRNYFYKKAEGATHAQIVGRQFYIDTLEKLFEGTPEWSATDRNFPKERNGKDDVFDEIEYWDTKNPVIQIKTSQSMRNFTHSDRIERNELPFWGNGKEFRNKYYNIGFIH
jgi:hypothetical protein